MVSLSNIKGSLTDTEFEIGGTRFFISKLSAVAGFDLLETIRHELGKSTSLRVPDATSEGAEGSLLQMVLSLNPSFVAYVRTRPSWPRYSLRGWPSQIALRWTRSRCQGLRTWPSAAWSLWRYTRCW